MNWKRPKLNIRQQVLLTVLAGSLLTLFALGAIGLYGMYYNQKILTVQGKEAADSSADYTEQVVKNLNLEILSTLAKEKAYQIDRELAVNAEDAVLLADTMTEILNHPERYTQRHLSDPRRQKIHSGEVYIWYSPGQEENLSEDLRREIGIAANVEDALIAMGKSYENYRTSCFFGSRKGYFICTDIDPEKEIIEGFNEQMTDFDPRERPWYIMPPEGKRYTFSEVFVGVEGFKSFTAVSPYYDAQGFAGVAGVDAKLVAIKQTVEETGVGQTGFSFVLNHNGNILFSQREEDELVSSTGIDLRKSAEPSLAQVAAKMTAGESGIEQVHFDGADYYLAYAPMKTVGWSFATLISKNEVAEPAAVSRQAILAQNDEFLAEMNQNFYRMLIATAVIIVFIVIAVFVLSEKLASRFSLPILTLSDGVREISSGNLDKKLEIHTGDEIEHLATCFNAMTDELKVYMANLTKETAENERISTELKVAMNIQQSMLPNDFPQREDFELFATMKPAKYVGGDFYDFYLLDENHLVITIADVSGKGVPAAIFMSRSMTILKNFATMMKNPDDLAAVMALANNQLCQGNDGDMFVTVFMGMLDFQTGEFVYVNGGHNPPLLRQGSEGSFKYLPPAESCMLGILEDMQFTNKHLTLLPASTIFIYTDGLTEAMNAEEKIFGIENLQNTLNNLNDTATPQKILSLVKKAVKIHANGAEQSDDITMLSVFYKGK